MRKISDEMKKKMNGGFYAVYTTTPTGVKMDVFYSRTAATAFAARQEMNGNSTDTSHYRGFYTGGPATNHRWGR